jgi:hypothetical protein
MPTADVTAPPSSHVSVLVRVTVTGKGKACAEAPPQPHVLPCEDSTISVGNRREPALAAPDKEDHTDGISNGTLDGPAAELLMER